MPSDEREESRKKTAILWGLWIIYGKIPVEI